MLLANILTGLTLLIIIQILKEVNQDQQDFILTIENTEENVMEIYVTMMQKLPNLIIGNNVMFTVKFPIMDSI